MQWCRVLQVDKILTPGLRPGAARVFLQFLSYSDGPLPERQLAAVKVPVSVVWGAADPWEKVHPDADKTLSGTGFRV
jgi:hypothetical protein